MNKTTFMSELTAKQLMQVSDGTLIKIMKTATEEDLHILIHIKGIQKVLNRICRVESTIIKEMAALEKAVENGK